MPKGRFQTEVHLGLLGMLCLLLLLNLASNYIIHNSTSAYRTELRQRFAGASREATRLMYEHQIPGLAETDRVNLQTRYNLRAVFLLPAPDSAFGDLLRHRWDSTITLHTGFGRPSLIREHLE